MNTQEIGSALVRLCNENKAEVVAQELYARDIVSYEGHGVPEPRTQGFDALMGNWEAWYAANEVHTLKAEGPFMGHRSDQFGVRFEIELTPKGAARTTMTELALYTVKNGKIAEEEFLYFVG